MKTVQIPDVFDYDLARDLIADFPATPRDSETRVIEIPEAGPMLKRSRTISTYGTSATIRTLEFHNATIRTESLPPNKK